jgi:hypothetical protein
MRKFNLKNKKIMLFILILFLVYYILNVIFFNIINNKYNKIHQNESVIFISTDCKSFQSWQISLFLFTAKISGETSDIIRIVSGCSSPEDFITIQNMYTPYDNYYTYETPDYSYYKKNNLTKRYSPLNRACALDYWVINFYNKNNFKYKYVAIYDSDFILTRAIKINTFSKNILYKTGTKNIKNVNDVVTDGISVAQKYALGTTFMKYKYIFNNTNSPLEKITIDEANEYSVGSPYILYINDFIKMTPYYCSTTKKILDIDDNSWVTEMYGYILSIIHIGVKQTALENYIVSHPDTWGEATEWIDNLTELENPCVYYPEKLPVNLLPNIIHYCQTYKVKNWYWSKYIVPKNILTCESDLFKEPPPSLWTDIFEEYKNNITKIEKKEIVKLNDLKKNMLKEKRNTFFICSIIKSINRMLLDFKKNTCISGFNSSYTIFLK